MILLDPKPFEHDIANLAQKLQKIVNREIESGQQSQQEVFLKLTSIVEEAKAKHSSNVFDLFADRWLKTSEYKYLVGTNARPEFIQNVVDEFEALGHLNILYWIQMRMEIAASYSRLGDTESESEIKSQVSQRIDDLIHLLQEAKKSIH